MPKGPQVQKRYADVTGNAVHIMRIATGVAEERCGKVARSLTYTATTLARALEWLRPMDRSTFPTPKGSQHRQYQSDAEGATSSSKHWCFISAPCIKKWTFFR
jgi:hypothetical protein